MKLYWYQEDNTALTNVGDIVTPYLYTKLTKRTPVHSWASASPSEPVVLGCGSILWAKAVAPNAVIWGSGIITRQAKFCQPREVRAVRGPITRRRMMELGYECPEVYGDPGLLVSRVFHPGPAKTRFALGIVAHYVDEEFVYPMRKAAPPDVCFLNVRDPMETFLQQLNACDSVVSSSLHGVILAHAYGIPAMTASFGGKLAGDGVKFADYAESVGIPYIYPMPVASLDAARSTVSKAQQPTRDIVAKRQDDLLKVCPFR